MPQIIVEGPRIENLEKKRKLAADLTEAAIQAFDLPKEVFVVLIKENLPENVAVGGQLIVDRKK